ncbi:hypothetical protein [Jiangella endophytica]|nr:hypothetical protein [Jiangella endophytica]
MRQAYAHDAVVVLGGTGDERAPGGATTSHVTTSRDAGDAARLAG